MGTVAGGNDRVKGDFPESRPLGVLFVGRVNAGRSLMAEALLRHQDNSPGAHREGDPEGGRFRAYSAGLTPCAAPNPEVLDRLRAAGVAVDGLTPKPLEHFLGIDAPPIDLVITVSAMAATGMAARWPGQPVTAHWDLPDPDPARCGAWCGDDGEAERRAMMEVIFDHLRRRVALLAALPAPCLLALSHWQGADADLRDAG